MALIDSGNDFRDWVAKKPTEAHEWAKTKVGIYRGLDSAIKEEVTGGIDPTQTEQGQLKMRYGIRALNYANVPRASLLSKAGVLLTSGLVSDKQLAENAKESLQVIAAVPTEYMWTVVNELNERYEEVLRLVASIDAVIASFTQGLYPAAEGKVQQAKTDMALLSYNLTLIMQLVEKVSQALPAAKKGGTNAQKILEMIFQVIDALEEFLSFIEDATNEMTPEEYDRVMALYDELVKDKTKNPPAGAKMFYTLINGLMAMLLPYITNLALMLTMECFNAIMKIIKKIPGVGDIMVPPLDMIPSMVSLVGLLLNGNFQAVLERFGEDIQTIFEFMRAVQKIAHSSPEKLARAEEAVAKGSREETRTAAVIAAADTVSAANASASAADLNTATTLAILEEEKTARIEGDAAITEADQATSDLVDQAGQSFTIWRQEHTQPEDYEDE